MKNSERWLIFVDHVRLSILEVQNVKPILGQETLKPEEVKDFLSTADMKTTDDVLKRGEGLAVSFAKALLLQMMVCAFQHTDQFRLHSSRFAGLIGILHTQKCRPESIQ